MGKILLFDPRIAGVAGDMIVAALVDLRGMTSIVYDVANAVEDVMKCKLKVEVKDVRRGELRAKAVKVVEVHEHHEEHEHEHHCGQEVIKYVRKCSEALGLSKGALEYSLNVVRELVEAEAFVHGVKPEEAHLHELSSPDTVFDITCTAKILDKMGVFNGEYTIYTLPPALGGGFIKCEHGMLPVPAPATLEILRRHKFKYSTTKVPYELTTPTGIALLANLVNRIVDYYPAMQVEGVGYGAGERQLPGIPNVLRVVEGTHLELYEDKVVVLETNIDDVPGELMGYLVDKLLSSGAIDVVILPGIGKKNRPAHVVKVIAEPSNYMNVANLLMKEAGTLGVRIYETPRVVALRRKIPIEVNIRGRKFTVIVKISRTPSGELFRVKPEYEDLKNIARETGLTLREVYEEVWRQLPRKLREVSEE